jgi:hypothetical protein
MSTPNGTKINQLISQWPAGLPYTSGTLKEMGYSKDLIHQYLRSNWLESLGRGLFGKKNDIITWKGYVSALQYQMMLPIHIGAKSALLLQNISHYARFGKELIWLYTYQKVSLPKWMRTDEDNYRIEFVMTHFLDEMNPDFLNELDEGAFKIRVSGKELAIFEVLHLVPDRQGFDEAYKLMEMLPALRPQILQTLLESCNSYKVKRLFLYMAKRLAYPWFERLRLENLDLGRGKRQIVADGRYDAEFRITVPRDYE